MENDRSGLEDHDHGIYNSEFKREDIESESVELVTPVASDDDLTPGTMTRIRETFQSLPTALRVALTLGAGGMLFAGCKREPTDRDHRIVQPSISPTENPTIIAIAEEKHDLMWSVILDPDRTDLSKFELVQPDVAAAIQEVKEKTGVEVPIEMFNGLTLLESGYKNDLTPANDYSFVGYYQMGEGAAFDVNLLENQIQDLVGFQHFKSANPNLSQTQAINKWKLCEEHLMRRHFMNSKPGPARDQAEREWRQHDPRFDAHESIKGALLYLIQNYRRFGDDWQLAFQCYHDGPGATKKVLLEYLRIEGKTRAADMPFDELARLLKNGDGKKISWDDVTLAYHNSDPRFNPLRAKMDGLGDYGKNYLFKAVAGAEIGEDYLHNRPKFDKCKIDWLKIKERKLQEAASTPRLERVKDPVWPATGHPEESTKPPVPTPTEPPAETKDDTPHNWRLEEVSWIDQNPTLIYHNSDQMEVDIKAGKLVPPPADSAELGFDFNKDKIGDSLDDSKEYTNEQIAMIKERYRHLAPESMGLLIYIAQKWQESGQKPLLEITAASRTENYQKMLMQGNDNAKAKSSHFTARAFDIGIDLSKLDQSQAQFVVLLHQIHHEHPQVIYYLEKHTRCFHVVVKPNDEFFSKYYYEQTKQEPPKPAKDDGSGNKHPYLLAGVLAAAALYARRKLAQWRKRRRAQKN